MRFTDIYSLLTEDKLSDRLDAARLPYEKEVRVKAFVKSLANKTKYIDWVIRNVDLLDDKTKESLDWFERAGNRPDIEDKDINHYDPAKLKALHDEKSETRSQERRAVAATTDEDGAEKVFENGKAIVWRPLKWAWMNKNFSRTNWCIASSGEHKDKFDQYTGQGIKFYVVHDKSRTPYSQFTGTGDKMSDVCVGVKDGMTNEDAMRQTADNTDIQDKGVYAHLASLDIDPKLLGLPRTHLQLLLRKAEASYKDDGGEGAFTTTVDGRKHVKSLILRNMDIKDLSGLGVDSMDSLTVEYCDNIKDFTGFPKKIGALRLFKLKSLKDMGGCPEVDHLFVSGCPGLVSLKGCPDEVVSFVCSENKGLSSLEGCPSTLKPGPSAWSSLFNCSNNSLTSLEGCPRTGVHNFKCGSNPLSSLEGGPVSGLKDGMIMEYDCSFCKDIQDLQGMPTAVGVEFSCRGCSRLTSLAGGPVFVGQRFDCGKTGLETLDGCPRKTSMFVCDGCKEKFTKAYVKSKCDVKGVIVI